MKRYHQGLDYTLYKIYAFGGGPVYAIYVLAATYIFDALSLPGPIVFLVLGGPLMLWIAGILLYWWWVFLFKGNKELDELTQVQGKELPGIQSLKSWNTLHQAMAVHGGNVKEFVKNAKKANRPMIVWYGFTNLMAVWICGPVALGSLEIIQVSLWIWLGGAFVLVASMLVLTYVLLGWGGRASEKAYLAPLGLGITRIPGLKPDVIGMLGGGQVLIPDGPAIVEGERHGRLVHIETIDKHSLTVLQAKLPEFKLLSKEGKLAPAGNAPEDVLDALKSLRKAKRWRGIAVYAGPEGIAIQRESKGTNMWLYDLWLAEYLLGKISAG